MAKPFADLLRDLGRGMVGALLLGAPFLFTMETWWLGWTLPGELIVLYTTIGLLLVLVVVHIVGFREEDQGLSRNPLRHLALDFTAVLLECFVIGYAVLLLFGVMSLGDPLLAVARMGLMQVVPLSLGAALANRALAGTEADAGEAEFPKDLAIFALGATFFIIPIAPTEEMDLMASRAGWGRLALVMVASLLLTYLALYELAFKGQAGRIGSGTPGLRIGETFLVYVVGLAVSFGMLGLFGHFTGQPFSVWVQETLVLGFIAALGGSAARVVL